MSKASTFEDFPRVVSFQRKYTVKKLLEVLGIFAEYNGVGIGSYSVSGIQKLRICFLDSGGRGRGTSASEGQKRTFNLVLKGKFSPQLVDISNLQRS
jgi:hypothetical protein